MYVCALMYACMSVHVCMHVSVAHAPRNVHRKIPTLTELEREVKAAIPAVEVGG